MGVALEPLQPKFESNLRLTERLIRLQVRLLGQEREGIAESVFNTVGQSLVTLYEGVADPRNPYLATLFPFYYRSAPSAQLR